MESSDASKKISIQFQLTCSDVYTANHLFGERKNLTQARRVISIYLWGTASLFFLCYAVSTAVYLISGDPEQIVQAINPINMLFWSFWIAFGFVLWFDVIGRVTAWISYRANAKSYNESALLTVDESGLTFMHEFWTSKIEWQFYVGFMENAHLFILFDRNGRYSTIPKRALASEAEINSFREMITRKIQKANK